MIRREIGRTGREVNAIGLGCMGMSIAYGEAMDQTEAVKLLHAALDRGVDHFDTAELYGFGANEELLGAAFHDRRDKAFIATKFGPVGDLKERTVRGVDGSEANMRRAIEQSLRLLETDHVDLYYLHRKDPGRPIEETVEAMAKLVKEGKIGAIGLSEVNADSLRRAQAVHPIAAVQWEYSLHPRYRARGAAAVRRDRRERGGLLAARPRHADGRLHPRSQAGGPGLPRRGLPPLQGRGL